MNTTSLLLIVAALALALVGAVLLFLVPAGPSGALRPEQFLPQMLEGFQVAERQDRVEGALPGEQYSAHAFFIPSPGSAYEKTVERLGITIFQFGDRNAAAQAKDLLMSGSFETVDLGGEQARYFFDANLSEAGLIWQQSGLVFYILVMAPSGAAIDQAALRSAALQAALTVQKLQQR